MYAIIGLGNPGDKYEKTRHNVGFMTVDRLNSRFSGNFSKGKGSFFQSKISLGNTPVLLVKPVTYMNLSGQAVRQVIDFYKIDPVSHMLLVLDDFNLPFGTLRIKQRGSAGGQNGLKSVIDVLKTDNIPRLRFGIQSPGLVSGGDARHFVLSNFNRSEQQYLPEMIEWAAEAAASFVTAGPEVTMNKYNRNFLEDSN